VSAVTVESTQSTAPPALGELSDEELTALALAADPNAVVDDDAVPFGGRAPGGAEGDALLPDWYMPAPMLRRAGRTRRVVLAGIIGALLVVNAAGLCVTYGLPEIAW
jgi:hypothetical protein